MNAVLFPLGTGSLGRIQLGRLIPWRHTFADAGCAELFLCRVYSSAEFVPAEVGPEEFDPAEAGPAEVGPAEIGIEEVGIAEVGPEEVGTAEVGLAEVGLAEVGPGEVDGPRFFAFTARDRFEVYAGEIRARTRKKGDIVLFVVLQKSTMSPFFG